MQIESGNHPSGSEPELRLRYRGQTALTEEQVARRQKVLDRIVPVSEGVWHWTGQAKTARGRRYPQFMLTLPGGMTLLQNARHIVFYLAIGWVSENVQQYRAKDGDPLNVHPDNLVPLPPLAAKRASNNLLSTEKLQELFG